MSYSSNLFFGASAFTHQRARELRKRLTPAERILWESLRNKQLDGYKFRRQHPINRYIADFYCHELRLVVELDGAVHDNVEQAEHDRGRSAVIGEFGIRILRFRNWEVVNDLQTVLAKIKNFAPP